MASVVAKLPATLSDFWVWLLSQCFYGTQVTEQSGILTTLLWASVGIAAMLTSLLVHQVRKAVLYI